MSKLLMEVVEELRCKRLCYARWGEREMERRPGREGRRWGRDPVEMDAQLGQAT